jgi:hypothetical protein
MSSTPGGNQPADIIKKINVQVKRATEAFNEIKMLSQFDWISRWQSARNRRKTAPSSPTSTEPKTEPEVLRIKKPKEPEVKGREVHWVTNKAAKVVGGAIRIETKDEHFYTATFYSDEGGGDVLVEFLADDYTDDPLDVARAKAEVAGESIDE